MQAAPLSARRLERRRVLDAAAAELLLGPLAESGEYVQTGEQFDLQEHAARPRFNRAPSNVYLFFGESEIFENEVLHLGVTFEDPNFRDTHRAVIDWGDGTPKETFEINRGARYLGTSHRYLDDNPTATSFDVNTIKVQVFDQAGKSASAWASVKVKNIAPKIDRLSITSPIDEGDYATLTGRFRDPGMQDSFELDIDWDGDNTFDQTIVVSGGRFRVSHQFLDDNPSGTLADRVDVKVRLRDDDLGFDTRSVPVIVKDVSPFNIKIDPIEPIDENGFARIRVTFDDPGSLDTHFARINWGDGSPLERVDLVLGERSVIVAHQYLDDNSTGTPSDRYLIRVGIVNDDLGRNRATAEVLVNNVAPTIDTLSITSPINEGQFAILTGTFTDPGSLDKFELDIDWDGDHVFDTTVQVSGGEFRVLRPFLDDNPTGTPTDTFNVNVRLRDDDGGAAMDSVYLTVNNVDPVIPVLFPVGHVVNEGETVDLVLFFADRGILDTQTVEIDWGDGTATESIDVPVHGPRFLIVPHTYLDDNPTETSSDFNQIRVTVTDDDGGRVEKTTRVKVKNVSPTLVLDPVSTIDENGEATLSGTITDPGSLDTFTLDIAWDDPNNAKDSVFEISPVFEIDPNSGVLTQQLMVGDVLMSITVDDPTKLTITSIDVSTGTVGFRAMHRYLDDGIAGGAAPGANGTLSDTSTIRVSVEDDDSGFDTNATSVKVLNLDPEIDMQLVLPSSINETESVTLSGSFSDIGSLDFQSIEIRWGDGAVDSNTDSEDVNLTFTQEFSGSGSFIATHTYADNDTENPDDLAKDNIYSIVVIVTDDDGGKFRRVIDLEVLNVDPILEPIADADATDVNTDGETFVTITFSDIGADVLTIWVDWGDIRDTDNPFLPGDNPYVEETPISIVGPIEGPGTYTVILAHTYAGPPNPLSPAADIELNLVVTDDDFSLASAGGQVDGPLVGQPIVEPGRSDFQMTTITNPGIGSAPVAIDTTPQVPRLIFPSQEESLFFVGTSSGVEGGGQTTDLRTAVGDTKSTTDRFLELRVIDPATGQESEGYRLKPEVLNDLPGLFRTLPDNRYAIYLIRTETNSRRLVIEVYVRNGKLIDPGDDSEGTRDRPPTDEPELEAPPKEAAALEPGELETPNTIPADPIDNASLPFGGLQTQMLLGTTLVGLAASKSGQSWAERIDRALATADSKKWRHLRQRQKFKRKKPH